MRKNIFSKILVALAVIMLPLALNRKVYMPAC